MKRILTTFLFCMTILISSLVKAQKSDSTQALEPILKIENPYKKGKTKWLNSQGFNTSSYRWYDPAN